MWGSQGWNQWALQPAMFNDVPHEQIDWAELAKQWIQMQQTPTPDAAPPPPPPPPRIPSPASLPPPPGHNSLPPDDFPVVVPPRPSKPVLPASVPEPFHSERMYDGEQGTYMPKAPNNFWNKPQWESNVDSEMPGRHWPPPMVEPAAPLLGGKETFDYGHVRDNPPLAMQSIDYNHMSEFSYDQVYHVPPPPPETHYDQYWSHVNAAPSISPMFLKKTRTTSNLPVEDTSQIDAAKRKSLPAWIRDGLEKMEQERFKKLKKELADKEAKEHAEILAKTASLRKELNLNNENAAAIVPSKSKFESDSEEETEKTSEIVEKKTSRFVKEAPLPVEDLRTEEEKKQEMMLKVRHTLTEVLLSVTNSEMLSIAQEMYKKAASKAPARQLASATMQSSVESSLRGLASYGTESETSEVEEEGTDSEEELYRKIKEKKNLFAIKERKIIAELEQKELEEKIRAENRRNEKVRDKRSNRETANIEKGKSSENNTADQSSATNSSKPPIENNSKEILKKIEDFTNSILETEEEKLEEAESVKDPRVKEGSSDSSASSSDSESESSGKRNKKSRDKKKHRSEVRKTSYKKERISDKHSRHHKRSRSRDSGSPEKHKRERSEDRKNSYKKKRSKRSGSSSSSGSSHRKSKHRYESNHRSHERDHKGKRSRSSSRSRRKTESHYSHRYKEEKRHHRSPSPSKHSTRLPRKYRSSSSESEGSGKKSKKYRNH